MYGRIALVLPNQPCIGGVIASKTCKGPADIEAMMMYTEQQVGGQTPIGCVNNHGMCVLHDVYVVCVRLRE